MDSKIFRRTLIGMLVVFTLLVLGIVATNLDKVKKKLGIAPAMQVETDMEDAKEESDRQIGNDLSAFLQDETFFDADVQFKSIQSFSGKSVSMVMRSVSKDLRIMIVDSVGELVTGAPFTVELQGVGEYTDEDMDGVIYIDKLKAGEYSVLLREMDGFSVPNTITTIQVRQDIEYRVLSDIEYLILTEDDVDKDMEDFRIHEAEEEADETEDTQIKFAAENGKVGIDVSKWNGDIDWELVKESGVEYAIIRCGYRGASSGSLILDPKYKDNVQGAIEAQIPVGIYFYTQAINETEAIEEASMVIHMIEEYDIDYPVFLDSESAYGAGRADDLEKDRRTEIARAFLRTVASAGYETGIYGSKNWLMNELDMEKLQAYNTWVAEYSDVPTYDEYYQMWQYTSKGTISGIDTDVDLNICYMNIDTSIDHGKGAKGYSGVVNGDAGNTPTNIE